MVDTPLEAQAILSPEEVKPYGVLGTPLKVFKTEKQIGEWSPERKRSEYLSLTDDLIGKLDGSIPLKQAQIYRVTTEGFRAEKRDLAKPDAVIYLDKSARPVRWFVHQLWPILASSNTSLEDNAVPDEPDSYFLNIDKKDWLIRMGIPAIDVEKVKSKDIDFSKIDRKQFARIRALFSNNKQITEENIDSAWSFPTIFDGKHIMMVDEIHSSGLSLEIAQKLLSIAIPEAVVSGQYWAEPPYVYLNGGVDYGDGVQRKLAWVPDWYDAKNEKGRGVYDVDEEWPEKQLLNGGNPSRIGAIGRYVISTPPHQQKSTIREEDTLGTRLRQDIKKLAFELENHPGKELYRPSNDRMNTDDEIIDRIERLNQMSYDEWRKSRDELLKS